MAESHMTDLPPANQVYTTEQIISALHEMNGMVYLAAKRLKCSANTIYRRAREVQAVQRAIDDSRGELVDIAEQKLRQAVLDREPWAVALVVKTLGKERGYTERQEVTGAAGKEIIFRVTYGDPGDGRGPEASNAPE